MIDAPRVRRDRRLRLPTQCAVCRGWDLQRLCRDCTARWLAVVPRCRRCAARLPGDGAADCCGACLREPPPWERAVALADYAWPWDTLVSRLKYHAALELAPLLADALAERIAASGAALPQWVLPVPLSDARLRERGYNQAWELARRVARRLGCRSDGAALLRIKDTPPQLALPREARAANLRGAFLVAPRRAALLRDADIALVDDVLTTGATAGEAARTLHRAGAARVQCWVVARTPLG